MTEQQKEFNKLLKEVSFPSKWQIEGFKDFLELSHIALAQPFYQSEEMEKRYLEIAGKYKKEELDKFAKMLAIAATALGEKHHDFLGEVFMGNEMGDSYKGQFFTPYHISYFMAQINLGSIEETIKDKGYFSMCEPTCGSGGIVIACAETVTKQGFNPSEVMWCQAQDIDNLCFMMTYIQLSLLDVPARVVLGDTLAFEENKVLYTPAFIREDWFGKIDSKDQVANNSGYSQEQLEIFANGVLF